jgi:exo-beta-1,3-glucanase (GH17 family)
MRRTGKTRSAPIKRKRAVRLGTILGLIAEFIYVTLSIPTASGPMFIHYSPEAMRDAVIPEGFPENCSVPVDEEWIAKVDAIRWVAYGPPGAVPGQDSYQQKIETINQDLTVLKKAGFSGLVTYGSSGIMGRKFLSMAQALGYQGVIMGIWNPSSPNELKNARNASSLPIVLGYSIGNEGLYGNHERYTIPELCAAMADLRLNTGKPVTTSEEIDDYSFHPELLFAGDWLFPNAHPYWHSTKRPLDAVKWETTRYEDMAENTGRFVLFKEVGLPTSGAGGLSEANHDLYYRELAKTDVRFVYFEGFDRPSKDNSSVEPYWGIFDVERIPKLLGWNLMGYRAFTSEGIYDGTITECPDAAGTGCKAEASSTVLLVGDDASDRQYRGILSFNTSLLPDDAVITSIRIKIRLETHAGMNPFSKRRQLKVDMCTSFGSSVKLQPVDFQTGEHCVDAGTFTERLDGKWFAADLQPVAFPYINKEGGTQFRLRYDLSRSDNGKPDYIRFYSGDSDALNRPVLVLRYSTP